MRRAVISVVSLILVLLLSTLINFGPNIQPVKAQQQSSGSFSDDFSSDSGAWQYVGSAYRDQTNQYLVLTNSSSDQTGIAFFRAPIQGSFVANFSFICGGTKNDGLVMFFYKQQYPPNLDYAASYGTNGVAGGRTGFNSGSIIPGYGIEFDGWQNIPYEFADIAGGTPNPPEDPNSNHIALIKDFTGDHLAWVDDQMISANVWHQVSVQVQGSSVAVFVDQELVLQWNGTQDRTYDGFGFSGSNGEVLCNTHIIANFSITTHDLHTPALTSSCLSQGSQSSFNVYKINGNLTFNGAAIAGAPILLSYSVTGGESWQDLTRAYTGSDGSYSALWMPTVTGSYILKAVYKGDENYLGTSNTVNFAIQPGTEQSVFSVTSNSTVTALFFDSANNELSFNVTGVAGTYGYVDVCIPKSLLNDTSALKVYLDSNQIPFTVQSQSYSWLLYFTYHHSSHSVMISLGTSANVKGANGVDLGYLENYVLLIVIAFMAIIIAALILAFRGTKKRTDPPEENK